VVLAIEKQIDDLELAQISLPPRLELSIELLCDAAHRAFAHSTGAERLAVQVTDVPRREAAHIHAPETLALRDKAADEYRALELARCDELTLACWPKAMKGDAEMVRAVVRVMQRRAALCGLDAVVAQRLELKGGPLVMTHENEDLSSLTTEQLEAKLGELSEYLRSLPRPTQVPAPEPEPPVLTPGEQALADCAKVLAERASSGNGSGSTH
jgi:hypothetical protein